jgi:hypothetical protein
MFLCLCSYAYALVLVLHARGALCLCPYACDCGLLEVADLFKDEAFVEHLLHTTSM